MGPKIQGRAVMPGQYWTPNAIAELLDIGNHTVLKLIGLQQLKASNIGTSIIPRWKISQADLDEFLAKRSNMVQPIIADRFGAGRNSSSKRIIGEIK